jgi:hypothetical protein
VDKADWRLSVLPGPIVLVSTVDAAGEPNGSGRLRGWGNEPIK